MLAALAALCIPLLAKAMPANPKPFTYTQPDGRQFTLILIGDEHAHEYITTDSLLVDIDDEGFVHIGQPVNATTLRQKLKQARAHSRKYQTDKPHSSTLTPPRGLLILVNFANLSFKTEADEFDLMMNQPGYGGDGIKVGSARDYFEAQSMGQYIPTFDVIGPVTVSQPYSYYGRNLDNENKDDQHPEEMIYDAVKEAVEQGLVEDLTTYDHDHDGIVDMVYVIYAGKGENNGGSTDTVWPHMWDFRETNLIDATLQELHFGLYACSAELDRNGSVCGIGTFCHEFGHCLGLPDLYDVDYSGGFGLGDFDIMSSGGYLGKGWCPPAYSAFERHSLGWIELEELTIDGSYQLEDLKNGNKAYRITSHDNENEYFILENRQQFWWDRNLPAHGMMITHIDYEQTAWDENTVNDNPDHPRVTIIPADGKLNSLSTANDLYPSSLGNDAFTDDSSPAAVTWDGTPLQRPVTNIQETADLITFQFKNNLTGISHQTAADTPAPTPCYNILGQHVLPDGKGNSHHLIINNGKKAIRQNK